MEEKQEAGKIFSGEPTFIHRGVECLVKDPPPGILENDIGGYNGYIRFAPGELTEAAWQQLCARAPGGMTYPSECGLDTFALANGNGECGFDTGHHGISEYGKSKAGVAAVLRELADVVADLREEGAAAL